MTTMPDAASGSLVTWRLYIGPLAWAIHFLAIYGFTALACARDIAAGAFGVGIVAWFVGAATVLAVVVLGFTIWFAAREGSHGAPLPDPSGFVHWLTLAMAALAMLAVVWEALPLMFLKHCA